jgi:hypothetical protein
MKKSMIDTFIRVYGLLRFIMRKNEEGYHPKMEEIQRHCTSYEAGREELIHYNTVHDYIRELETLMNVQIVRDRDNGYYIKNLYEWGQSQRYTIYFFDMLWMHTMTDKKGLLQDSILFENLPEGVNHLPDVLLALWNHHPMQIVYRKPATTRPRIYQVEPRGLRQYLNRYYLIAYDKESGKTKNLGFHAMQNVEVHYSEKFQPQPFSIREHYRDFYGTWVEPGKEPVDIVLRAKDEFWAEFLQTPPFHHTLRKLEKKEGTPWTDFVIHVVPMPDLVQTLMRFCPHILVLEPPSLRDYMKRLLKASTEAYDNPDQPLPDFSLPDKF